MLLFLQKCHRPQTRRGGVPVHAAVLTPTNPDQKSWRSRHRDMTAHPRRLHGLIGFSIVGPAHLLGPAVERHSIRFAVAGAADRACAVPNLHTTRFLKANLTPACMPAP